MKVLICGAGIAGLTAALCLRRWGHQVVLVEKAPALRNEGYMVDFFGPGFDACEKMGLLGDLASIHYPIGRVAFADGRGHDRVTLAYPKMRKRVFGDRHFNFMRGDLERVLWEKQSGETEIRFDTSVEAVEDGGGKARVHLTDGSTCLCDVVIGADGLHSRVRELVFGSESKFFRFLGFCTAAYIIETPVPEARKDEFRTITVPDKQVGIYPIRGQRTATYFVHRTSEPFDHSSRELVEQEMRSVYGNLGWIVPELLDFMPSAESIYFDSVAQIMMPSWSRGRVVLVGDSCWCVSLLAGQGASLAVAGAYMLAEELNRTPNDISGALARYEARLRTAVERRQASGRNVAKWFVPETQVGIVLRDFFLRMSVWPGVSWYFRKQFSGDGFL